MKSDCNIPVTLLNKEGVPIHQTEIPNYLIPPTILTWNHQAYLLTAEQRYIEVFSYPIK